MQEYTIVAEIRKACEADRFRAWLHEDLVHNVLHPLCIDPDVSDLPSLYEHGIYGALQQAVDRFGNGEEWLRLQWHDCCRRHGVAVALRGVSDRMRLVRV